MIVTQEEATTRGCPLRVVRRAMTMDELTAAFVPGELGNGTIPTVSGFAPCLHEQCMAWRWADAGMDSEKLPESFRADEPFETTSRGCPRDRVLESGSIVTRPVKTVSPGNVFPWKRRLPGGPT